MIMRVANSRIQVAVRDTSAISKSQLLIPRLKYLFTTWWIIVIIIIIIIIIINDNL